MKLNFLLHFLVIPYKNVVIWSGSGE